MRTYNAETIKKIETFIDRFTDERGYSPTLQEIADAVGIAKTTAYTYVTKMCEDGLLNSSGVRSLTSAKFRSPTVTVPVLGAVACGISKFSEDNIKEYVRLPQSLYGSGNYFILPACGESMIGAGIHDGDLVLVRQQDSADEGQIVVALIGEEATLKRFYPEPKKHRIRLHPENSAMEDIFVSECEIQGIAVKVLGNLN